jgi:RNA 2',3'-cyclic 3'-phosphodiesterase
MTDDVFVRAFVALPVGEDVRSRLAEVQAKLRQSHAHVGWVAPENIHVSLAFMGDILQSQVAEVAGALNEAAARAPAFSFEVENIGVFGSPRSPRVIWAGIRECPEMMALQKDIAERITALGIELETRPFRPHLTLGRVRSGRGREDLVRMMEPLSQLPFGPVAAQDVRLMRSILKPQGAEHSVLHRATLQPVAEPNR